jgi:hypothetical protein
MGALHEADGEGDGQPVDWFVLLAARLAGTVRDRNRDEIRELLADMPDGRWAWELLAVTLAAMVDDSKKPSELLAWMDDPKVRRRRFGGGRHPYAREHGTERGYKQHRDKGEDACDDCLVAHRVHLRSPECQAEYRRLVDAGVAPAAAADATTAGKVAARAATTRLADRRRA